jgi:hypothetical protein
MTALAPVVAIAWFIAFALGVSLLAARQLRELWRDLRSPRRDPALVARAQEAAREGLRLVPRDEVGAMRERRRPGGSAA